MNSRIARDLIIFGIAAAVLSLSFCQPAHSGEAKAGWRSMMPWEADKELTGNEQPDVCKKELAGDVFEVSQDELKALVQAWRDVAAIEDGKLPPSLMLATYNDWAVLPIMAMVLASHGRRSRVGVYIDKALPDWQKAIWAHHGRCHLAAPDWKHSNR